MSRVKMPMPSEAHGTRNGYNHHRCRCLRCTEANRLKQQAWRTGALEGIPTVMPVHGRASTYRNWRCRCAPCAEAHYIACKTYNLRRRALARWEQQ